MTRIARVVAPGVPHHVTQRGNRRHFCEARNVSNLLRHLSREISVVHRSYVNICHLIAVHNDRLAMVLATLYMEPLGPCFHEANGDATATLVPSLPR
jgi:hypothetical protein